MKSLNPSFADPLLSMAFPFPNRIKSIAINIPAVPLPSFLRFPCFLLEHQSKSTKISNPILSLGAAEDSVGKSWDESKRFPCIPIQNVTMSKWNPWNKNMGSGERKIGIFPPKKGGGRSLRLNFWDIPIKSNVYPLNPALLASNINPTKFHLESSMRSPNWNSVAS